MAKRNPIAPHFSSLPLPLLSLLSGHQLCLSTIGKLSQALLHFMPGRALQASRERADGQRAGSRAARRPRQGRAGGGGVIFSRGPGKYGGPFEEVPSLCHAPAITGCRGGECKKGGQQEKVGKRVCVCCSRSHMRSTHQAPLVLMPALLGMVYICRLPFRQILPNLSANIQTPGYKVQKGILSCWIAKRLVFEGFAFLKGKHVFSLFALSVLTS